jgi:hypothetical protein
MADRCGEVICADTVRLEAQCPELYRAPDFGSFIRADSAGLEVFGVVYHISTGCIDSSRRTQALGLAAEEIARRLPHLDLVLRTTFAARVVGFRDDGGVRAYLPAQPARIHCFVARASGEEVRLLTADTSFLRTLATAPDLPTEDVIASAILYAHQEWAKSAGEAAAGRQYVAWGKYLARMFRNDYDRFEAIMQRLPALEGPAGVPWEGPFPLASPEPDPFE